MNDTELLDQITRKIVERFHPRRIILFGSQARGKATSESDLDLFVEMETQAPPPRACRRGEFYLWIASLVL